MRARGLLADADETEDCDGESSSVCPEDLLSAPAEEIAMRESTRMLGEIL
jgi:hypothetical protein